jgi:antitoxin MazE
MISAATIHRWGNGHGILIPKRYLDELGLKRGDGVEVTLVDGGLEVRPAKSNRVEDLLRGYTGPRPSEYDWGQPAGEELW